ncbi:MAG: SAM-dependent methyltransferase, partial [Pirellulales bacterium]|nr:SAM-dependent methyltransferase [Pirellulales bacterium]
FATYLQARGWLSSAFLQKTFRAKELKDALTEVGTARKMFDWLAETFNGDVFPHRSEIKYSAGQLKELKLLLEGGDPRTRQRYLWPYEFGVIPVELLSAIYESFSHKIAPHAAGASGVHYTPINLVELTLGEVFDDALFEDVLPKDAKVADLACGSGVFLVQSLRRLVARRIAAGEKLNRNLIRGTLYNQIFGIDRLGGAVHIAAVSLYLAALELDPHPGVGNGIKFKPLIYPENDKEKQKERRFFNLFEADAFDTKADFNRQKPFAQKQLSVVIGNPPWTRPEGEHSEKQQGKKIEIPLHVQYCRERDIQLPNQDPPEQAFFWRAADFATADARLGLILSGRRFFSHDEKSVAAKRDLLLRFAPLVMMNLGELHREKVFPTALHPAMILVARNRRAERGMDCTYATVERSETFPGHGVLEIGPELIKPLSVYRAAQEEDFLKIASWGSARDAALIDHLKQYPTLKKLFQKQSVDLKQGFTRGKEKKRKYPVPRENIKRPCLEEKGPIPFIPFGMSTVGLPPLKDEWMQRPRKEAIYRGPLFLFTLKLAETGLTSSICPAERLVYSQRYYGIPLPKKQDNAWAYCLNGIINSSLATYFIFLTAAEWGVERNNVNGADVMRLPMPEILSGQSPHVKRLLDVEEKLRTLALQRKVISKEWRRKLNAAVFDLYDLDPNQRILVEDMVTVTIDFQRNIDEANCLHAPEPEHLDAYAQSFLAVINEFLRLRNERKATAEVFDLPGECPLQVVKFTIVSRSSRVSNVRVVARQEYGSLLDRIAKNLPDKIAADVYTRRNVRFYGPGEVYLIKPAQVRFWTRSAGMNDADAVLAEHLRSIS